MSLSRSQLNLKRAQGPAKQIWCDEQPQWPLAKRRRLQLGGEPIQQRSLVQQEPLAAPGLVQSDEKHKILEQFKEMVVEQPGCSGDGQVMAGTGNGPTSVEKLHYTPARHEATSDATTTIVISDSECRQKDCLNVTAQCCSEKRLNLPATENEAVSADSCFSHPEEQSTQALCKQATSSSPPAVAPHLQDLEHSAQCHERMALGPNRQPPPLYAPCGADPVSYARVILASFNNYFLQLSHAQSAILTRIQWGKPIATWRNSKHPRSTLDFKQKSKARRKEALMTGSLSLALPSNLTETYSHKKPVSPYSSSWLKRSPKGVSFLSTPAEQMTSAQRSTSEEKDMATGFLSSGISTPARSRLTLKRKTLRVTDKKHAKQQNSPVAAARAHSPLKSRLPLVRPNRDDCDGVEPDFNQIEATGAAEVKTTSPVAQVDTVMEVAVTRANMPQPPLTDELQAKSQHEDKRDGASNTELLAQLWSGVSIEYDSPPAGSSKLALQSGPFPSSSTFLPPGSQVRRQRALFLEESDSEEEHSPEAAGGICGEAGMAQQGMGAEVEPANDPASIASLQAAPTSSGLADT